MARKSLVALLVVCGWMVAAGGVCADKPIHHVATDQPLVALTFDDGPSGQTGALLKLFEQEGVKATFFVKGKGVADAPELAKQIVAKGHEIGNHTYTHADLSKLDEAGVRKEIADTQAVVKEKVGVEVKVFRAPFLRFSPMVWKVLTELDLPAINASSSVKDWDKATTVEDIVARATEKIDGGSIILMHDWAKNTFTALPEVIRRLKEKGFRFVTMSELLAAQRK